jgi:hypothetical protein
MPAVIRTWRLANGLTIEVEDDTINYYGDYYHVRLFIRCPVEVKPGYLESSKESPYYDRIVATLGSVTEYRREIVKAGVPGREVAAVKEYVLRKFEENALPYFEREGFSERLVQKRFAEVAERLSKEDRAGGVNGD